MSKCGTDTGCLASCGQALARAQTGPGQAQPPPAVAWGRPATAPMEGGAVRASKMTPRERGGGLGRAWPRRFTAHGPQGWHGFKCASSCEWHIEKEKGAPRPSRARKSRATGESSNSDRAAPFALSLRRLGVGPNKLVFRTIEILVWFTHVVRLKILYGGKPKDTTARREEPSVVQGKVHKIYKELRALQTPTMYTELIILISTV